MIESFLIMLFTIVLRIVAQALIGSLPFLAEWIVAFDVLMGLGVSLFVVFAAISVIKRIR